MPVPKIYVMRNDGPDEMRSSFNCPARDIAYPLFFRSEGDGGAQHCARQEVRSERMGSRPDAAAETLGADPGCAGFSFIRVTSPGSEGTINLVWGEHPIAWVDSVRISAEIMARIPEHRPQETQCTPT